MRTCRLFGLPLLGAWLGVLAFAANASAGSIGVVPNNGCLAYSTSAGTVYFCDTDIQPTGTGVFEPFLRVQKDGPQHDGTVTGYTTGWNTDATNQQVPPTNDMDHAWTESLFATEIGYVKPPPVQGECSQPVNSDPQCYALFTVDINQQGNQGNLKDILTLNHFELFNCTAPDDTNTPGTAGSSCTSFFDLFAAGDWVNFDYRIHEDETAGGSGAGDIDVYIPGGAGFGNEWITLLDGWGCGTPFTACNDHGNGVTAANGLFPDNDGFQEWRSGVGLQPTDTTTTTGVAPEPTSLFLLGIGLSASAYVARRRQKKGSTS